MGRFAAVKEGASGLLNRRASARRICYCCYLNPSSGEPAAAADLQLWKAELNAVLSSDQFARAPRLRQFLRYVSDKVFEGDAESIKEYSIAVEALGRSPNFDSKRDSIVRVDAHQVRRKLLDYYAGPGAGDPVLIDLPVGHYVPVFRQRSSATGFTMVPASELPASTPAVDRYADHTPTANDRRAWFLVVCVLASTLLILLTIVVIAIESRR